MWGQAVLRKPARAETLTSRRKAFWSGSGLKPTVYPLALWLFLVWSDRPLSCVFAFVFGSAPRPEDNCSTDLIRFVRVPTRWWNESEWADSQSAQRSIVMRRCASHSSALISGPGKMCQILLAYLLKTCSHCFLCSTFKLCCVLICLSNVRIKCYDSH